ncbi:MAG TPA: helix-turn-helix transcriptional regulator [Acidimicrobiia bacterium]|nr:helix-turn-helix transcriptional regulator [Acidimicrobiia bacterium]
MARAQVGDMIRDWRTRRRFSQLDLAVDAGISARHLSFVETGRSRPSPEMLLLLAERLEVPLRERNTLLLTAGYAPRYSQLALDDNAMAPVREAVQRMLDAHHPYPGVAVDRLWNVVLANQAARALTELLLEDLLGPPVNVYRACLHPDGLASHTLNFEEWAGHLLRQLDRSIVLTGDATLEALRAEVGRYPNVAALGASREAREETPPLLVPFRLEMGGVELSLFTTLTSFGTPLDVTLDELAIELFFPADQSTAELLHA